MTTLSPTSVAAIFRYIDSPETWYCCRAVSNDWNVAGKQSMTVKVAATVLPHFPNLYSLQTPTVRRDTTVVANLLAAHPECVKESLDLQNAPLYVRTVSLAHFLANVQLLAQGKPIQRAQESCSNSSFDGPLNQISKERIAVILDTLKLPGASENVAQHIQDDLIPYLLKNKSLEDEKLGKSLIELCGPIAFAVLGEKLKNSSSFALWMIDALQSQKVTEREIMHHFVSEVGPDVLNDETFGRRVLLLKSTPDNKQLIAEIFRELGEKLKNNISFLLYALKLFSDEVREDLLDNLSKRDYGIDPSVFDSELFGEGLVSIDFSYCKYLGSRLKNDPTFMGKLLGPAAAAYNNRMKRLALSGRCSYFDVLRFPEVFQGLNRGVKAIISNAGQAVLANATFGYAALEEDPESFSYLSCELRNDPIFIQKAIEITFKLAPYLISIIMREAGPDVRANETCALRAATLLPECFLHLAPKFKESVPFVLSLLQAIRRRNKGELFTYHIMEHAGKKVKADPQCAMLSSLICAESFEHINPKFHNDVQFARQLLPQLLQENEWGLHIHHFMDKFGPDVLSDRECVSLLSRAVAENFKSINQKWKNDVPFVKELLEYHRKKLFHDGLFSIFHEAGPDVKKDVECARIATMRCIDSFQDVDPTLKNNSLFVQEMLKYFADRVITQEKDGSTKVDENYVKDFTRYSLNECIIRLLSSMGSDVLKDLSCRDLILRFFPESEPLKNIVAWYQKNPGGKIFECEEGVCEVVRFWKDCVNDIDSCLFKSVSFVQKLIRRYLAECPPGQERGNFLTLIMMRASPEVQADPICHQLVQNEMMSPNLCTIL